MSPKRRRCGGTSARSSPPQRDPSRGERLEPRDRAQQRRLAATARPEDRDGLAGPDVELDAVDHGRRPEPHDRPLDVAASELAELAHVQLLDREHDDTGDDHQHRRHRHRLADVELAGPGEEPRDRDRDRRRVGPRRRTASRRTRRATPRPRIRTRPRTRASRSAGRPRATRAAAARRARRPRRAGAGRSSATRAPRRGSRTGSPQPPARCGTSIALARRSTGQRSSATRNPKPTVTADVPSGSINSVSIVRVARPGSRRDHHRREPSDHHRDQPPRSAANSSEFRTASHAGTNKVSVARSSRGPGTTRATSSRPDAQRLRPRARAADHRGTRRSRRAHRRPRPVPIRAGGAPRRARPPGVARPRAAPASGPAPAAARTPRPSGRARARPRSEGRTTATAWR